MKYLYAHDAVKYLSQKFCCWQAGKQEGMIGSASGFDHCINQTKPIRELGLLPVTNQMTVEKIYVSLCFRFRYLNIWSSQRMKSLKYSDLNWHFNQIVFFDWFVQHMILRISIKRSLYTLRKGSRNIYINYCKYNIIINYELKLWDPALWER